MSKQKRKRQNRRLVKWFLRLAKGWRVTMVLLAAAAALLTPYLAFQMLSLCHSWYEDAMDDYFIDKWLGCDCNLRGRNIYHNYSLVPKLRDIDEVLPHNFYDDRCVVRRGDRYAILDLRNCVLTTPFAYNAVWPFNEGLAAVVDTNGRLGFLDTTGDLVASTDIVLPAGLTHDTLWQAVTVHGGLCALPGADGKAGLADTGGRWLLEPAFDRVRHDNGSWVITRGDSVAVADSLGRIYIPFTRGHNASVLQTGYVLIHRHELPELIFRADSSLWGVTAYADVREVNYIDDMDNTIPLRVCTYTTRDGHIGLLDNNGHILTEAIYSQITPVNLHLMEAYISNGEDGPCSEHDYFTRVLIDTEGNIIGD